MSLELDPVELGFRRPFTQEVEEKLFLRNPNSTPVVFKVKTTAPKQYCVRPNSGRIEAGEHVMVSVLLQAMKEEPPSDAKCRDKFLVQSVAVPAGAEASNSANLWSEIEKTHKASIQEKKIRVSFLPQSYATNTPNKPFAAPRTEDLPAYGTPAGAQSSQQQTFSSPDKPEANGYDTSRGNATVGAAAGSTIAAAASTVSDAVPQSTEELKSQLAEAQRRINNLTAQVSEGLRQRRNEPASKGSSGGALGLQQAPSGVAVPTVAGLCLLSFLIAYLLF